MRKNELQMDIFDIVNNKVVKEKTVELIDVEGHIETKKRYKVISLFSGCGGMDLGFRGDFNIFGRCYEKNPYDIVYSNDIVQKACNTYEHNFKHKSVCADIKNLDVNTLPEADIVIGGFPCQDFSHAGKRQGLDAERGRLYLEMKRVIDHVKPIAFIAENVDGIRTSSKGADTTALDIILKEFEESGYNVTYRVLHAADYGAPQTRIRVIITGVRKDYNVSILYPKTVRGECAEKPWMTTKEAIDDLWDRIGDEKIFNHSVRDYSKAKFYPGKRMQGNCQVSADKPAMTIRAEHHGNIEGHYRTTNTDEPDNMLYWRRLSVRECARIQTFPDDFEFNCAASDAYKQIGNAVPPILGWYIARALYKTITQNK